MLDLSEQLRILHCALAQVIIKLLLFLLELFILRIKNRIELHLVLGQTHV